MQKFAKAFHSVRAGIPIVDFIADEIPLSKGKIKEAMQKGAVWLQRKGEEPVRVRRAKDIVKLNDEVHIYYDEEFLAINLPPLRCVESNEYYSIYIKPEGILQEVTLYGDHLSLERLIERDLPKELDCYFVDPANGEITGLVLIVHNQEWAASLEKQQLKGLIQKHYRVTVKGEMEDGQTLPFGDNAAPVTLLKYNAYNNTSLVRFDNAQAIENSIAEILVRNGFQLPDEEQLQCCSLSFLHVKTQKKITFTL